MKYIGLILLVFISSSTCAEINFCDNERIRYGTDLVFCQDFVYTTEKEVINKNTLIPLWTDNLNNNSFLDLNSNTGKKVNGIAEGRVTVQQESSNNNIQIKYPKDMAGGQKSGASWIMKLTPSHERLTLTYKVKFQKGFEFSVNPQANPTNKNDGGKLPGLCGGKCNAGNIFPDKYEKRGGTNHTGEGWSARYMWDRFQSGLLYLYYLDVRNLKLAPHAYPKCKEKNKGSNFCKKIEELTKKDEPRPLRNKYFAHKFDQGTHGNFSCSSEHPEKTQDRYLFKDNIWYTVQQTIQMNTIKENDYKRDGYIHIYVKESKKPEAKLVVKCNNLAFRIDNSVAIDHFFFSSFFGREKHAGEYSKQSPNSNQYVYFDDFSIIK